jgi:diguanylate cyclase
MNFKSLQNQIIFVFLALIIGIQLIGLIPIEASINENARKSAEQDLMVGESVFINILEKNTENLNLGAKILAADFGFRDAVSTNDDATILSALSNHQSRINADIAFFYSTKSDSIIVPNEISEEEAHDAAYKLIEEYTVDNNHLNFEIFNNQAFQLVAVPVKAPLLIGWVVMGFKVNNLLALELNKLSNLQVTFIQRSKEKKWSLTATTLNELQADELFKVIPTKFNQSLKKLDVSLAGEEFDSRVLNMHEDNNLLLVVLQQSLTKATLQFRALETNLLILISIGLIIFTIVTFYISKYITAPITSLSDTANQLALGNYDVEISTTRKDEIGHLSNAFNAMREAIALREKKVTQLAFWDDITGLPNRAAFIKQLDETIITHQIKGLSLVVLVLNINRFKQINKILGRQFADEALKKVGVNLKASVRRSTDLVARLNADEYAVLLPDAELETAYQVAKNIIKTFEHSLSINEQTIDIDVAIGIAVYPQNGENYERLLINAETALQISKQKKIDVAVYDESQDLGAQDNLALASELKTAIQKNHLALFLQPKVNIQNKKAYAAEALIRWIHPEKGFIFPDQFIPFAEQTGLIPKITLWMLNEACKVHALFIQQGIHVNIAVNIAMQDLIDQDFPSKIATMFKIHDVDAKAISLEVTESSIMDDPKRAEATLLKLFDMGLKLSIDDFGTGYSSLSYLKRLPVTELKIDRSFVMNMENSDSDISIVRSTIDLAHNLNLKVVAEGIESQQAWDLLDSMGCDYGQGYWMGKPMPVNQYADWLQQWEKKIEDIKPNITYISK